MFRRYWREPRFWVWWLRQGAPREVRWVLGLAAVVLVLGGGFLAADRLSKANAGVSPTSEYTFVTTIQRNVTVRDHGRTIIKKVPVIRRVLVRPQTMYETRRETRVVTTPGKTQYVQVVRKQVVTVAGKRQIRTRTVQVPSVKTVSNSSTSTVVTVVETTLPVTTTVRRTATETTTVVSTVTQPAQTVTNTVTTTVPAVTVTIPITITIPGTST
jgi:hypothetical protein